MFRARTTRPLLAGSSPKRASPRSPMPQWRPGGFLPLTRAFLRCPAARRVIPRETTNPPVRHPPLRCGPLGAASIASGVTIAIEAAMVAGSETERQETTMANIGTFKKSGNELQGEIVTLSFQARNVRIVPEANRPNDNATSHRIFVGRAALGAGWSKRSTEGRDYLSVKLDDPSVP